jgi:hypothetical protein
MSSWPISDSLIGDLSFGRSQSPLGSLLEIRRSQDLLRGLQHDLESIQQSLNGMSPVVQVIGLAPSLIENVLPVLFPSVTFVSGVDSLNCIGVHATLTMAGETNQCYTTWNLRLGEQSQILAHAGTSRPSSRVDLDVVPQAIQWLVQQQAELF